MTQEETLTALYEKMAAEQDKYRDWLKGQPAAEVLNHAYEYTVREDIVMCMEELELTEAQAKALLASPAPLADIYKDFEKLETSYMDVIRDTIETRANELYQAQEKLKNTPLYPHSAAYASEHGEMAQYNASFQASHACKEAIEQAISRHYSNNRLDAEAAVNDVLERFGSDRVQYVLANTVRHKEFVFCNRSLSSASMSVLFRVHRISQSAKLPAPASDNCNDCRIFSAGGFVSIPHKDKHSIGYGLFALQVLGGRAFP